MAKCENGCQIRQLRWLQGQMMRQRYELALDKVGGFGRQETDAQIDACTAYVDAKEEAIAAITPCVLGDGRVCEGQVSA